jgi:hypothetical protein
LDNLAIIQALIRLPEQIRGFGYVNFGHVKQQTLDRANKTRKALLAKSDTRDEVIKMIDPWAA